MWSMRCILVDVSHAKSVLHYNDMIASYENDPLPRRRRLWSRIDYALAGLTIVGLGVWAEVLYKMLS